MSDEQAKQAATTAGVLVAPVMMRTAFHCVYCDVLATQAWKALVVPGRSGNTNTAVRICTCFNCDGVSYWLAPERMLSTAENPSAPMLWPLSSVVAPGPHTDMPEDAREDYDEARSIVERSPRGAAALLRLALQKLMVDLGEEGKDINKDIGSLVNKGLAAEVQQALDAVRVIGNECVHPGELDMKDDRETAVALFGILNFIVAQRITQAKRIQHVYGLIPANKLAGIQGRDKPKPKA
jgi:hypothetical protein